LKLVSRDIILSMNGDSAQLIGADGDDFALRYIEKGIMCIESLTMF
jgi:hypothetical protein